MVQGNANLESLVPVLLANVKKDLLVGLDHGFRQGQSLGDEVSSGCLVDSQGIQSCLLMYLLALGSVRCLQSFLC